MVHIAMQQNDDSGSPVTWGRHRLGAAPCRWFSSGAKKTRSPGRMTSTGPLWDRLNTATRQVVGEQSW